MIEKWFVAIALLIIPVISKSQEITNSKPSLTTICGIVVDDANRPVEFVTIVLSKEADSMLITGTTTNSNGRFDLQNIKPGNYYITTKYIGYKDRKIPKINLSGKADHLLLDTIKIATVSYQLNEVTFTGKQKTVEVRADKKVLNIGKDVDAAGGTAIDILQKMPSVSVDIEGNVMLRNRSDILVLIDGKPSTIQGSEALTSISASMIDKIEIINNPSAKYESTGLGGIINIILKKKVSNGLGGMMNLTEGLNNKQKAEINLEYAKDIFLLNCMVKYSDMNNYGVNRRNRYFTRNDSIFYMNDHFDRNWSNVDNLFKIGGEIKLPKFTAGVDVKLGVFKNGNTKNGGQHTWTSPGTIDSFTANDNTRSINYRYYDASANFDFTFNKHGHSLKNLILFSNNNGNNSYTATGWEADNLFGPETFLEQSISNQKIKNYIVRLQSDYTLPLSESNKIEAGILFSNNRELMDYSSIDSVNASALYYENHMNANNRTGSVYINYHGTVFSALSYQVGVRAEYTQRSIQTNEANYEYNKTTLFPAIFAAYKFPDGLKISFSANQRIKQPDPWLLVPFPYRNDLYNISIGNPNLKPEYLINYELTLNRDFHNFGNVSFSGFIRDISNNNWQISTQLSNNLYQYSYQNINKNQMTGAEIQLSPSLPKPFSMDINSSIFRDKFQGVVGDSLVNSSSLRCDVKTTIGVDISKTTHFQIYFSYHSTEKHPQGVFTPDYFTNLSLKQDLLKKSLSMSVKVTDVFNTTRNSVEIADWDNSHAEYRRWRYSTFMVSVTYNFHNYKNQKQGDVEIERGGL